MQLTREGTMAESKGYVITLDDITDLLSAQRTGAWADVARRIAHEIKNPLTPIQLSAERLRRRYGPKLADDFEVFDKSINTILRQVGDIGRMVDEILVLRAHARGQADQGRSQRDGAQFRVPRKRAAAGSADQHGAAGRAARRLFRPAADLAGADQSHQERTEAIEGSGVETTRAPVITVNLHVEGDRARVSISDNGKGWPKENRQRLLETYITTREKGTGLGLAIVARIIEQHGGTVDLIDAEPDEAGHVGACFTFTLPLSSPDEEAETSNERAEAGAGESAPTPQGQEEPPVLAVEKT